MIYRMIYPVKGPKEIGDPQKNTGVKCLLRCFVIEGHEKRDQRYPGEWEKVQVGKENTRRIPEMQAGPYRLIKFLELSEFICIICLLSLHVLFGFISPC